jgi:hypothetical protein
MSKWLGLDRLGALVFAAGVLALGLSQGGWLASGFREVLRDLGIAFLVASLLMVTVERLTTRVQLDEQKQLGIEIKTELERAIAQIRTEHFLSWLKSIMSPAVYDQFQQEIIGKPFVRRDYHLTLRVTELPTPGYVKVVFIDQYTAVSQSDHAESFLVYSYLDRENDEIVTPRILSAVIGTPAGWMHLDDSDLADHTLKSASRVEFRYRVEDIPEGGDIFVSLQREKAQRTADLNVWVMTYATEGLVLSVEHPASLNVQAWASHPSPDRMELTEDKVDRKQWVFPMAFLPYQGVTVRWRPTTPSDPRGASDDPANR